MDARKALIRIVLVCLLLYAAGVLARLGVELEHAQRQAQALTARLEDVERENAALRRALDGDRSTEEWEELAWRRLGLVKPGEIVFTFPERETNAGGPRRSERDTAGRDREDHAWSWQSEKSMKEK